MKTKFTFPVMLILFTCLFSNLKAQIMCTDIVPDSVVSIPAGATNSYTYDIDVNNDAMMDFRINMVQNGNFGFVNVQATQIGTNNAVLANGSNTALALTAGSPITPTSATWVQMNGSNQQMSIFALTPPTGSYPGMGDRFLGVRFLVGPSTYYGWVRFNFSNVVNSFTVMDYGYNATANGSITAGQLCASPPFAPTFTISSPKCVSVSQTLTANTGTNVVSGYTWAAVPAGAVISTPNSSTTSISFTNAGTFSVTLTAISGTTTASQTNTILINPNPSFSITTSNMILCSNLNQSATLTASGASTYTWSTGPNTATINVTPSVTTTYSLTGSTASGCTATATFTQSAIVCEGLQQLNLNKQSFSVHPNPANEKLFVVLSGTENLDVTIEVLDLIGKVIIKELKKYSASDKIHEINIRAIPQGIYFVRINTSGLNQQVIKVIKD